MNHWKQRKPMWAIEMADGTLMGANGTATLYDRRTDARSVLGTFRHFGDKRFVGIVKVQVKYERL